MAKIFGMFKKKNPIDVLITIHPVIKHVGGGMYGNLSLIT